MLELLVQLLATIDYCTSMIYAGEIPFITVAKGIIVCNIHIYNIMTIPKLHSNQMLQIAPIEPTFLKLGHFLTRPEMSVINREEFTIPPPLPLSDMLSTGKSNLVFSIKRDTLCHDTLLYRIS